MKTFYVIVLSALLFSSCQEKKTSENETKDTTIAEVTYDSFGKEITFNDALEAQRMAVHYSAMKVGDTVNSKMTAKVDDVCQAKGCWMKLNMNNGEQVMVKFKDYGFFVPTDIKGKEVVVNGIAFVNEMSVDELRHYAEDEGLSEDKIAEITEPKKTWSFEADGVLIKQ